MVPNKEPLLPATTAKLGPGGELAATLLRPAPRHRARSLRLPGGRRLIWTDDPGSSSLLASEHFQTNLSAVHFDGDGKIRDIRDLGSGLVQQNLVVGLQQDQQGTTTNKAAPLLANSGKYMYTGTGGTANAYDYQLGATAGPASGSITPTLAFSAGSATLLYTGTVAYGSILAITEWGLFNTNSQGAVSTSTVNTFTSTTITSATWGTTLGGSANMLAGYVVVQGTIGGFILQNGSGTSGTVTIGTGWYNLTSGGGAASTPTTNTSTSIYPLMSDHKTFAALNVVSGDSVQYQYTFSLTDGG